MKILKNEQIRPLAAEHEAQAMGSLGIGQGYGEFTGIAMLDGAFRLAGAASQQSSDRKSVV